MIPAFRPCWSRYARRWPYRNHNDKHPPDKQRTAAPPGWLFAFDRGTVEENPTAGGFPDHSGFRGAVSYAVEVNGPRPAGLALRCRSALVVEDNRPGPRPLVAPSQMVATYSRIVWRPFGRVFASRPPLPCRPSWYSLREWIRSRMFKPGEIPSLPDAGTNR